MELTRQRLGLSLSETSQQVCEKCQGSGIVRSVESVAVRVIRELEESAARSGVAKNTFTDGRGLSDLPHQ